MEEMGGRHPGIGFLDGFRFGCGFFVAGCLFWLLVSLIVGAIPIVLRILGAFPFPVR